MSLLFPAGYFLYKTVTAPPTPPLLRLDPYQRLLSALKMTPLAILSLFRGERPMALLPYSFFEPPVLATALSLLFLLLLGLFLKEKITLYSALLWFYLTLFPLLYQPSFGKIGLTEPPYLIVVGLFLIAFALLKKLVSR